MSFRSRIFCLVLAPALAFGCAREHEPDAPPIQVELGGSGECLAQVSARLSDYLAGRLTTDEIGAFWDCTIKAIGDFRRLTTGDAPNGHYTPEALSYFLHRYFLKSRPFSPALMSSFMQLKKVLLAGSEHELTRDELIRLQGLLGELKAVSLDIYPHVGVLFAREKRASDAEVEAAVHSLEAAIGRLCDWLQRTRQPYRFAQMHELISGLRAWSASQGQGDEAWARLEAGLTLAPDIKHILLAGDPDAIGPGEWRNVILTLVRGYGAVLKARYSFTDGLSSGLARRGLPEALTDLSGLLNAAVRARPEHLIPAAEWNDLFTKLVATGWLPDGMTAERLADAWGWLLSRPLGHGQKADGLTEVHARRLGDEATLWNKLILYSEGKIRPRAADPDVARFLAVRDASAPLAWDDEDRLTFALGGPDSWTAEASAHLVWPFVMVDWMKDAYAGSDATSLSEEQMVTAAGEILPVLQGFGWLEDTKPSIGGRILREADLFTNASDGDGRISVSEATRYLAFIASAYNASKHWLASADNLCGDRRADCVRALALNRQAGVLAPMPRLTSFLEGRPAGTFLKYMRQAEATVNGQAEEGEFSTGELLQVWMLFQYAETFIGRYDLDHSETIALDEALAAYQVFGPTLGRLLSPTGLSSDEVLAFFTFMMKYGDTPFTMFGGQILFNHWKWHRGAWAFAADRTVLMSILNQLAQL